ncbi:MAG TPA: penicillin-binding protein activator [Nitrospirales bacterium]|nr:penicillin-binding protein activator [Nitrospirales bacterium]
MRTRSSRLFPFLFTALAVLAAPPLPANPAIPGTERPREATTSPRTNLEHVRALINTQQYDAAIAALKNILAGSPKAEDRDDAYLLMAHALLNVKEHAEAIGYLNQLLTEFPESDLAPQARLILGGAYRETGNLDAALPVLLEAKSEATSPDIKRQALRIIAEIHIAKGDYPHAVQAWIEEMEAAPEDQRGEIRQRVRDLVIEKLDKKGLLKLRDQYPTEFPGDLALIRLIEMQASRGEEHLAERNARLFLHRFPNHEYAGAASDILRGQQAKLKASQHVIAALLPMSGRLHAVSLESLNGIQLAIERGKETLGTTAVGLKIVDSETDKAVLRSELLDTISEYKPITVIGPMLSRNLALVAGVADQTETPFITPSATISDVHRLSPYLFSTALTYGLQAQRIVDHAMTQLHFHRFVMLHPDTAYGRELSRLFAAEVQRRGGEVIAAESYKSGDTDFGGPIRRLKDADLKRYGTATTTKTSKGVTRIVYTPGFDAVFVPGDGLEAALIAPQLLFYDVKVPLLGSNTWNTRDLARLADRTLDGSVFVDGFYLESPDPAIREFVERYRKRFQSDPTLFAAQAYDAARVVLEAIRRGATNGRGVREQLTKITDLPTLSGPSAFGPGGALNKRLYVLYIKNGKLMQLN